MNFDLKDFTPRESYKLLTGVVVPRPIALVLTKNEAGLLNAAPFSFFNMVGSNPPLVALGIGDKSEGEAKDSAKNIRQNGEFVVNLVSRDMVQEMNICAVDFPAGISEVEAARLETVPSMSVSVPRLKKSPAALECRVHTTLQIGENRVILGEVVALYIADDLVDSTKNHVHSAQLDLVARMGGAGGYTDTSGTFELARLSLEQWKQSAP
ncbi:NADH-FMN oxidoreductase RutF, flavin reductase (DIM6/NTAB) family [Abditibacterium utsteinense]|uniref:NADH-FMN oxidoreductase RutF, flavin reductase (DIM6/NTAB) family n=1 Tax=Abditibacterium utsteinense TaxID=1960156 RepID=A0A2S8STA0_9BACT|nr:flavin reductase family protein [Abditibacterium utsteinense]PQV64008.1 NADH-FMN oxidoreductase RutF, flavin reductase (DIM6/NTAB) family [Abditibacterium utsteinense]